MRRGFYIRCPNECPFRVGFVPCSPVFVCMCVTLELVRCSSFLVCVCVCGVGGWRRRRDRSTRKSEEDLWLPICCLHGERITERKGVLVSVIGVLGVIQ